jgi:tetratricopeptide (TPR) repeat protein
MTLVPALLFGILELSLRLAGYGHATDFFVDGPKTRGPEVWTDNRDFGRRFFPRSLEQLPQPTPFTLPRSKRKGTYRIFVLGESAAQGFPDPSTSFARILEAMLRARYPETRFEVVNTAMVAINSHVALAIARECARHEPDLLVVHLGNNEVVGPFGAAGVLGPFSPNLTLIRANLAIKTTRSGELLDRTLQGLARGGQAPQVWDGMGMFVNSRLRAGDGRLAAIRGHFRQNLHDICRAGEDAGIPVVVCTIPVNLKDCSPFGSLHAPDLGQEQQEAWEEQYQAGVRLQAEKKFAEAVRCYQQADHIDEGYAELAFRLGACHAALGDEEQARRQYLRARDLDVLRFRCDTALNDAIRDVASAHQARGVRLADAERAFARSSPGELPGEDLFLEHVHMTFRGNHRLARTVFEALTDPAPAGLGEPAPGPAPLAESECAERLAQTQWTEWEFGSKIYERLIQGPPFNLQPDHEERCRRWKEKLAALRARLDAGGLRESVAAYRKALERADRDWMIRTNFAQLLSECGNEAEAREEYREVLAQVPQSYTAHYMLGNLELRAHDVSEAKVHFRAALRLEPGNMEASIGLAEGLEDDGQKAEALAILEEQVRKHPNRALALVALGRYLVRAGELDRARERFTEALEREPWRPAIHVDLGATALKQEQVDEAIGHFEDALRLQPEWPQLRSFLDDVRKQRKP